MSIELEQKAKQILLDNDKGGYTVPTHGLYPFQWNWDSAFVALGFAEFDRARAWQEVATLFAAQWEDGHTPHIVFHQENSTYFPGPDVWQTAERTEGRKPSSGITQPPVSASIVRTLWESRADDTELEQLAAIYPKLVAWHDWFAEFRDPLDNGLVMVTHPWETGRDNSVEWDIPMSLVDTSKVGEYTRKDLSMVDQSMRPTSAQYDRYLAMVMFGRQCNWDHKIIANEGPFRVLDVGMSMMLLRANRDLLVLAEALGKTEDVERIKARIAKSAAGINFLWNDDIGAYCSYDLTSKQHLAIVTNTSFLAWYADVGSMEQRQSLIDNMQRILGKVQYSVPSCDPEHAEFNPILYWRGPIWLVVNYMIGRGLLEADLSELGERVFNDTMAIAEAGEFYESFSPVDGTGAGGPHFSWSAAIWLHLNRQKQQAA